MTYNMLRALGLLCCTVALAQDVGMGVRKGSNERFEAPYTLEIETPHVKWAKPLAGGPIRLLAVPSVVEGRTLIELAQRVSLDLTTVSIDPSWDVNKWTMAFGRNYGARAERGDLKLIYSYLEAELTSDKKFDAILLPLYRGWDQLTPASRDAIAKRVSEGCGLVLIRPFENDLAPLIPVELKVPEGEHEYPSRAAPGVTSPWKRTSDHYITRAIPVEAFPYKNISNLVYRPAPGASVLIETEKGHPILAVKQYGKGRVIAFGYRSQGLSWSMPISAKTNAVDPHWEYFYSLLCRSLIYAAGKEPAASPDWNSAVQWRMKDALGHVKLSGRGSTPKTPKLPAGRYFLEQFSITDWKISTVDIGTPDKIEELAVSKDVIEKGDTVEVTFRSAKPARIELVDGLDRVIARGTGAGKVRLIAGTPLVHSGFVRASLGTTIEQIPVQFAAATREWKDYEIIMPWFGPHGYQPWIPALDEQFRRIGITTLANPERNFKIMASAHLPGFGIYWYRRDAYLKRKAEYAATGDKKYLTRDVVLQSPAFEKGLRDQLEKGLKPLVRLKPLAVYLADESSLTCYADPFDVDFAPEALAGFRVWLEKEYSTLGALNASWGTEFKDWSSVVPMTSAEAQKHGNFAPWADHRTYMEQEFVKAFRLARQLVKEIDPGTLASISGTQIPTAHNGCNWYALDQEIEYLQPYSGGSQDAMHYLFKPGMPLTGFTGYGLVGKEAQHQQWQRLFYGHTGASIFWHYTLLNPDLTMSEQGKALAEAFGRVQSGIGRVFMNSTLREDGVAIHFSMASIRGAWITDGKILKTMGGNNSANFDDLAKRRDAWVKELEKRGIQFRFMPTPQIEAGALDKVRVLVLPYSIALSDKEIREIERFMDRGGVVYADEQTGKMDERCHWRKLAPWSPGRKGLIVQGPGDVGVKPAIEANDEFQVTVRDFGKSRLIGMLPRKDTRVQVPKLPGITYDLLRGGVAAESLDAGQDKPVLLVNRSARIAKLVVDPALRISLFDEKGAPVDKSVVRVEVFDPAGRLVRHYSSNVTVENGKAEFSIPFAVSDAPGKWKVRARDVVSGITTERVISPRAGRI